MEEIVQVFVYSYCYEDPEDEGAGVVISLFRCVMYIRGEIEGYMDGLGLLFPYFDEALAFHVLLL